MPSFNMQLEDGHVFRADVDQLRAYAQDLGLDQIAPGRYSLLFVFKLAFFCRARAIADYNVIDEIRRMEGLRSLAPATGPATQFNKPPLKGLWHKHFFSACFLVQNLAIHHNTKRLEETVHRIMDPTRSPVVTKELINQLTDAVVDGAYKERWNQQALTGEWIIFSKHQEKNYYLTLATHPKGRKSGDQAIFDEIAELAFLDAPFGPDILSDELTPSDSELQRAHEKTAQIHKT